MLGRFDLFSVFEHSLSLSGKLLGKDSSYYYLLWAIYLVVNTGKREQCFSMELTWQKEGKECSFPDCFGLRSMVKQEQTKKLSSLYEGMIICTEE